MPSSHSKLLPIREGQQWSWQFWLQAILAGLASLAGLFLAWMAWQTWQADSALLQVQNMPEMSLDQVRHDLKAAMRARPDLSRAWRADARLEAMEDPQRALQLAQQAVRLNPQNWNNWRILGIIDFQLDHIDTAKAAFYQAVRFDHGFNAHFQLANFSWVIGDPNAYWREMQQALSMVPRDDVQATVDSVLHLANGQTSRLLAILPSRDDVLAAATASLAEAGKLHAANQLWGRLSCPKWNIYECHLASWNLIEALLSRARQDPTNADPAILNAVQVWNLAIQRDLFKAAPAHFGKVADGGFKFPRLGLFAWSSPSPLLVSRLRSSSSYFNLLEIQFSGWENSTAPISFAWVPVRPGASYRVSYFIKAMNTSSRRGVQMVVKLADGTPIVTVPAKLADSWHKTIGAFTVPPQTALVEIGFQYQRPMGEVPLKGIVRISRVAMQPVAAAAQSPKLQRPA